jgi:8-oxo-dGTP diphosphatase
MTRADIALAELRQVLDEIAAMGGSPAKTEAIREIAEEIQDLHGVAGEIRKAEVLRIYEAERLSLAKLAERVGISKARAEQIMKAERQRGAGAAEPSTRPEPAPVVAAIVTSRKGVLVGRRNDGKPPWAFIGGEIEPGESPADAAIREVKEETGLEIRAGGIIGRRVHPATKRHMIYMAARAVGGTDVFVGDADELAEVRWVSPAEADELMDGKIYEPVREHLTQMLER